MYPTSLNLIKYKEKYLGTPSTVFGFVQHKQAKFIARHILYDNIIISKTSESSYSLKPPMLKKPINKKNLSIKQLDTNVGQYFANINNIEIAIVDSISKPRSDSNEIEIYSNYKMDSNIDIDDDMRKYHIEMLFDNMKLDYEEEYNNMLILSFLNIMDDL